MFQYKEVNDYLLIKLLGRGTFGEVHLAESSDKQHFALKIIPLTQNHPNIVNAQQFFQFNKQKYLVIVLEYCPDGNLLNFIGKIDHNQCKDAEGLVYLHEEKKTLHRDIKPENILMLNRVPKIADLGIAKVMKKEGLSTKTCTIEYAAPEFLNEQKYSFPADIWSLGIVFLELLLGKRIVDMVKGKIPPGFRPDFPSDELTNKIKDESLRDLIGKMFDRDPKTRLTSKQVLEWLKVNNIQGEFENLRIDQRKQQVLEDLRGENIKVYLENAKIDERKILTSIDSKQFIKLLQQNVLFPNLTQFQFEGCYLTDKALQTLSKIPLLQNIFPKLWFVNLNNNQITDKGFKAFVEAGGLLKKLSWIKFSSNQITDVGLKALASCGQFQNLKKIQLSNNQITDVGLKALADAGQFENLEKIQLSNNQITDVGLKALASCGQFRNLKEIWLSNNQITDVGLKALAATGEFENLQLIDLDYNQITDDGLMVLVAAAGRLNSLQKINLKNNKITDEGLKLFAVASGNFKNLQQVNIRNQKVTKEGVADAIKISNNSFRINID